MPEPLSNQSGAEQELPQYIECLLSVSGDAAFLNTFDKAFRSGCGPQWADRPPNTKPRYSFHALFPVPEEIQRRGFLKAGRLWCAGYWEAGGDLCEMQVKRVLGERRYRFFVWDTLPKNMFRVVSRHYPTLKFCLTALIKDDNSVSERLAEDHIRTWSNEGDLVLAPFDKDGTVAKIAPLLERRWLSLQNAADCDGLRDNAG